MLAIASGKGGVGKSSVTVNLAVALAVRGLVVGILDADIWGFSVPRLLGMEGDVEARAGKMVPLERAIGPGTVRVLSMGFLADEEQAIMWRGLVLTRAVQQFLQDAHWGDLDYLLIDLPPGTGDMQMGLARLLPRTELLVVTTPPVAAQKVAARAADMARRGYLRVAGVIENMSDFTCEHGTTYALFGSGGGERLAHGLGVPLIGSIPLHPDLAAGGRRRRSRRPGGRRQRAGAVFDGDGAGGRRGRGAHRRRAGVLGPPPRAGRGGAWRRGTPPRAEARPGRARSCGRRSCDGPAGLDGVLARRPRRRGPPCPPGPAPAGGPSSENRATGSWRSVTSP